MYKLLCLLTGCLLAFQLTANGELSMAYGSFGSTVIIHIVGSVFAILLCLVTGKGLKLRTGAPAWAYLGGVVGVGTVLCNAFSYSALSVTSMMALALLGEMLTSMAVDVFGLFHMKKRRIGPDVVISFIFGLIGIYVMMGGLPAGSRWAIALAMCAGLTNVISRTLNAGLSETAGALKGSLINHLSGLPTAILLLLIFGSGASAYPVFSLSRIWIYCGGMLGVIFVVLCNMTVPRVNALSVTVLTFVGKLFVGIFIDLAMGKAADDASFLGGVIISTGILIGIIAEYLIKRRQII